MNDRSSVSHDYSSKSAERRLLCVQQLPDRCPSWVQYQSSDQPLPQSATSRHRAALDRRLIAPT